MPIRTTNSSIPSYWTRNQPARSHNGQYKTDGQNLYSYRKVIGITLNNGDKVLLDYTAPAGAYISQTTSNHVGKARGYCDVVMNVEVAREAGLI